MDTVALCHWLVLCWEGGGKYRLLSVTCFKLPLHPCGVVVSLARMSHLRESGGWFLHLFRHWTPVSLYAHPHDFITQAAQTVIHKQIQCLYAPVAQKLTSAHIDSQTHMSVLFLRGKRNWVGKAENIGSMFLFVSSHLVYCVRLVEMHSERKAVRVIGL